VIPQSCLLIETKKFPILDGEDKEITNKRMYGKALCQYLETELPKAGINVPFFCNEDWGWWLEVVRNDFKMALCIYSDPDAHENPERYALMPSIQKAKKWSWSKFRNIDSTKDVLKIINIVEHVLKSDGDIPVVTRHDEYPL
jgi:hypothetical protein